MSTNTTKVSDEPRVLRVFRDEAGDPPAPADPPADPPKDPGTPGKGDTATQLPEGAFRTDDFISALPEDLREHPSIVKHGKGGLESLARAFTHAQQLVGKDTDRVVELPGAEDGEGRVAVLRKLGAPEDTKGYELAVPENAPDFLKPDAENSIMPTILESAQKAGVLPEQMNAIYGTFTELMSKAHEEQGHKVEAAAAENIRALEGEWGQAFDQKVAAANFAIDKHGGEDLREKLNNAGLGTDPQVMAILASRGEALMKEDGVDGGEASSSGFGGKLTPGEAKAKGHELLRAAMNEKNASEQKRLNEEAQRYFKMANPNKTG